MFQAGDIIVPDQAKTFMNGVGWGANSVPIKYFKKAKVLGIVGNTELHIILIGGDYSGKRIYVKHINNRYKLESNDNYEIF